MGPGRSGAPRPRESPGPTVRASPAPRLFVLVDVAAHALLKGPLDDSLSVSSGAQHLSNGLYKPFYIGYQVGRSAYVQGRESVVVGAAPNILGEGQNTAGLHIQRSGLDKVDEEPAVYALVGAGTLVDRQQRSRGSVKSCIVGPVGGRVGVSLPKVRTSSAERLRGLSK